MKSIRFQLLVLIFAAILPALGIIIYSNYERQRSDIAEAEQNAYIIMQGLAHDHENAIEVTRKFLSTLAKLPEIQEQNVHACNKLFRELLKENRIYSNIAEANVQGKIIASSKPFNLVSIRDRKYFQDALRTKEFSVGEYVIGAISGRPSLPFAYPVTNSNGQVKGIILIGIDLDKYGQYFVPLTKLSKGSTLNLLDHKFRRLYRYPDTEKYIGKIDLPEIVKYMSAQPDDGIFRAIGVDGVKRLFAYKRFYLKNASSPYLYMRVGIPEEQALALAKHTFHRNIALFICSFILAMLIAWLMGNALIVKRLRIIVAASRRLGRGDCTARTNINYKEDELGWLAQSFDQMAESLEETELERKQSERSLKERVNELNCLYGISSLIELPDITIDEILQRTVMLIPPAWQFPEITEACIVLEKQTFQTANFRETPWILGNIIIVNGKPAGEIVVSYLEERPQSDEGPFLKEERQLIKAIAERLGRVIEHNIAEMQIRLNERRLMSLSNIMQLGTKTTQEFLDYALNEVIKITQSKIGYIYFYRENSKQFILNTWSKDIMKECTIADPQTCYDLEKTGVWGEAVRQRKPIIINDFQAAHPLKKGYPEGHAHLNKFLTVPVFKDDAIVAVVGVANKAGNYDETDVLQLHLFMDAVWKSVDIKMAEENLHESEERIRAIVNAAHDAIIIIDNNGNVSYWNPASEHILGYTSAEAIGRNLHELIAPERFLPSYHAAFPEFQRTGRGNAIDKTLELAARRKDGQEINVALSLSAVNIKGVWNAVGIIQDISERKQAESQREAALEALRKSEERFKQLAEVFPETIFEADMKGNVTYANEHGLKQFNFTEEDIAKGVNIFDMISRDDLNLAVERIQSRIQGGNKKYLEYQALKKDGSAFHALALSVPIILDGAPVGIRGFILDITERKRGEIYREMGNEILQILNKPGDLHDLIQSILTILKTRTGFDAVGIRLREGNDFPYIAESGFSNDFLLTENSLIQRGEDGGMCRDEDGNIKL
ncbi:MAG: PAS domain S-box protein, partial [Smithella sp.]